MLDEQKRKEYELICPVFGVQEGVAGCDPNAVECQLCDQEEPEIYVACFDECFSSSSSELESQVEQEKQEQKQPKKRTKIAAIAEAIKSGKQFRTKELAEQIQNDFPGTSQKGTLSNVYYLVNFSLCLGIIEKCDDKYYRYIGQ